MKTQDIYIWMESNDISKNLIEEYDGVLWPVYEGKKQKGNRLINSLENPEEKVRLKLISDLEKNKIEYLVEYPIGARERLSLDVCILSLKKGFELKPMTEFNNSKHLNQIDEYNALSKGIFNVEILTYDFDTKQYIIKDENNQIKYSNDIMKILISGNVIRESDLVEITNKKIPTIINNMIETLYKHNVSDYSRGLDIIGKLLACKLIDETNLHDDGIMELQVLPNENNDSLVMKLTKLYTESAKELNNKVDENYMCPSSQFHIINVDDEDSNNKNCEILREFIEQIQSLKFVNVGNVDFITKLFEKLESSKTLKDYGIFITDSQLTDFITKSLPIKDYIKKTGNVKLYYQDPAVGTGHFPNSFVNEFGLVMELLKNEEYRPVKKVDLEFIQEYLNNGGVKKNYINNYVTGIDVQKRNIELCRINTTLKNGNSIKCYHSNSLQRAKLCEKYPNKEEFKNNSIDVITSNYPFSVNGFIKDLSEQDKKYFTISKFVSDKSQEIEDLFLEDTIDKLKEGGLCGFIIFESILWKKLMINNNIRKKILKECEIISIVKLGSEAFKNTAIKSVIVFIRKRVKNNVKKLVNEFFNNYQPIFLKDKNVIELYADEVYGISFIEYVEFLNQITKNLGLKGKIENEIDKLEIFIHNIDSDVLYSDLSYEKYENKKLSKKQLKEQIKKMQREILGSSKSSYDEKKYVGSNYLPKLSEKIKNLYINNNNINLENFETIVPINSVINYEDNEGFTISFEGNSIDYLSENFENKNFLSLSEIIEFKPKTKHRADDGIIGGEYPFYTCTSDEESYKTTNNPDKFGEFLLINNGGESYVRITGENENWSASGDIIIVQSKNNRFTNKFIYKFLKNNPKVLEWTYKGSGLKHSSIGRLKKIMIPDLNSDEILDYLS